MSTSRKVGIIGSGIIGRSWAMLFSSFGYSIQLYDTNTEWLAQVRDVIAKEFAECGVARGPLSVDERMALISTTNSLEECVRDTLHIQECVFDNLALKQELFKQVDELIGDNPDVAICSSTSIHLPSLVFSQVTKHKNQCLVAHPVNPPLYVPLVELIPVQETREEILIRTRSMMNEVGMKPVILRKEVSGFALNRLQYAVFQVAFRLVHDGVMTPEDVDTVVSDGLGPRYAFMGPWMTAHLNAHGMADYFDRYVEGIYRVSNDCLPILKLDGEAAQTVVDSMDKAVPKEKMAEKRAWRDKCLVELARLKANLASSSNQ